MNQRDTKSVAHGDFKGFWVAIHKLKWPSNVRYNLQGLISAAPIQNCVASHNYLGIYIQQWNKVLDFYTTWVKPDGGISIQWFRKNWRIEVLWGDFPWLLARAGSFVWLVWRSQLDFWSAIRVDNFRIIWG